MAHRLPDEPAGDVPAALTTGVGQRRQAQTARPAQYGQLLRASETSKLLTVRLYSVPHTKGL